jgi:hypothetical protein
MSTLGGLLRSLGADCGPALLDGFAGNCAALLWGQPLPALLAQRHGGGVLLSLRHIEQGSTSAVVPQGFHDPFGSLYKRSYVTLDLHSSARIMLRMTRARAFKEEGK